MNRASPVDLRQAMESATAMVRAGLMFVAVPVFDEADLQQLREESLNRLERMAEEADSLLQTASTEPPWTLGRPVK